MFSSIINISEPYPSLIYQLHVRDGLLGKPQNTIQFLNSLLNQLNWAFSEFIGMIQEIHNISSRPERVFIESRQLKICATCFDLSVALLRVLEMLCTVAPDIFIDLSQSSRENLLSRLCQVRIIFHYFILISYINFSCNDLERKLCRIMKSLLLF